MINKQINIGWLLVGVLFGGSTRDGVPAGFGSALAPGAPSDTYADVGSQL